MSDRDVLISKVREAIEEALDLQHGAAGNPDRYMDWIEVDALAWAAVDAMVDVIGPPF